MTGDYPKFLEIGQGGRVLALCPSLETVCSSAKGTLSLGHGGNHSCWGINDHALHLSSPTVAIFGLLCLAELEIERDPLRHCLVRYAPYPSPFTKLRATSV
jgi:hypothetical protein